MPSYETRLRELVDITCVGFALALFRDADIMPVLLDAVEPMTSHEIADEGRLRERYVRDILDCLATAEVLHVSTNELGSVTYHIQDNETAVFNSRFGALLSFPDAIFQVYDSVKPCVETSGPNGFQIPAVVNVCMDAYYFHYRDDYQRHLLKNTQGLQRRLVKGIDGAEIICGTSHLLPLFAEAYPKSVFTALNNVSNLRPDHNFDSGGFPNVKCETFQLWEPMSDHCKQYDWVYCINAIHNVPHPLRALTNIRKLVKTGGFFTMIEPTTSGNPADDRRNLVVARMYALSTFFCIPETLFQDATSQALGMCWGRQAIRAMLTLAGFAICVVELGDQTTLFVCL